MDEILCDSRWVGNHGIGRFASELQKLIPGLTSFEARRRSWHPFDPAFLGAALWRIQPKLFFSPGYNSPLWWSGSFIFTLHDLHHLRVRESSSLLKRSYRLTSRKFLPKIFITHVRGISRPDWRRDELSSFSLRMPFPLRRTG